MSFLLILLLLGPESLLPLSITVVPGFTSRQACVTAGDRVVEVGRGLVSWTCVER